VAADWPRPFPHDAAKATSITEYSQRNVMFAFGVGLSMADRAGRQSAVLLSRPSPETCECEARTTFT